ncbi:hypothetical protein JTB14_031975 [Gonioctena quinquepunctata]|nr:hypothetical protein JTB14_031975 [Gonioctena quinquepunctata]
MDIKRKIAAGFHKRNIPKEMGINGATLRKQLKCGNVPLARFTGDNPANLRAVPAQKLPHPFHYTPPPAFQDITNLDVVCEDRIVMASTSKVVEEVAVNLSASDLLPLPMLQEELNRDKQISQKSEILSGTPFKEELEALAQEKKKRREADENVSCPRYPGNNTKDSQRHFHQETQCSCAANSASEGRCCCQAPVSDWPTSKCEWQQSLRGAQNSSFESFVIKV